MNGRGGGGGGGRKNGLTQRWQVRFVKLAVLC